MEKFGPFALSPEEIIEFTPEWKGERFDDGRPRVPDTILDRMKEVTLTEAWGFLRNDGYHWQYENGFQCTQPGKTLVGRALTSMYMPRRPVLNDYMVEKGERLGNIGGQISWPIDMLVERDVYVADIFGKIAEGAIMGDNLSTSIFSKSGNGVVHDGSIRDIEGVQEITEFVSFARAWHPTIAAPTIMLLGVNCPTRIGGTTVMPGDVVLGRDDAVVFIPPHLAEKVVTTSEIVRLRDIFGKQCLKDGTYTPGQIDRKWSEDIETDFSRWLEGHLDELPVPKDIIQEFLKGRTW